jgi:hypothetical protein
MRCWFRPQQRLEGASVVVGKHGNHGVGQNRKVRSVGAFPRGNAGTQGCRQVSARRKSQHSYTRAVNPQSRVAGAQPAQRGPHVRQWRRVQPGTGSVRCPRVVKYDGVNRQSVQPQCHRCPLMAGMAEVAAAGKHNDHWTSGQFRRAKRLDPWPSKWRCHSGGGRVGSQPRDGLEDGHLLRAAAASDGGTVPIWRVPARNSKASRCMSGVNSWPPGHQEPS